jgi:hypothetical protein
MRENCKSSLRIVVIVLHRGETILAILPKSNVEAARNPHLLKGHFAAQSMKSPANNSYPFTNLRRVQKESRPNLGRLVLGSE